MALPPWLNVSPQLFLQAAESGGSQGTQIASLRQQALEQDASRQAQAEEMGLRLQQTRANEAMINVARQNAEARQGRALDIKTQQGAATLALKQQDLAQKANLSTTSSGLRAGELAQRTKFNQYQIDKHQADVDALDASNAEASDAYQAIQNGSTYRKELLKNPNLGNNKGFRQGFDLSKLRPMTRDEYDRSIMTGIDDRTGDPVGSPMSSPAGSAAAAIRGNPAPASQRYKVIPQAPAAVQDQTPPGSYFQFQNP